MHANHPATMRNLSAATTTSAASPVNRKRIRTTQRQGRSPASRRSLPILAIGLVLVFSSSQSFALSASAAAVYQVADFGDASVRHEEVKSLEYTHEEEDGDDAWKPKEEFVEEHEEEEEEEEDDIEHDHGDVFDEEGYDNEEGDFDEDEYEEKEEDHLQYDKDVGFDEEERDHLEGAFNEDEGGDGDEEHLAEFDEEDFDEEEYDHEEDDVEEDEDEDDWTLEEYKEMDELYSRYLQEIARRYGPNWRDEYELVVDKEEIYERYLEFEERKLEKEAEERRVLTQASHKALVQHEESSSCRKRESQNRTDQISISTDSFRSGNPMVTGLPPRRDMIVINTGMSYYNYNNMRKIKNSQSNEQECS